MAKWKSAGHAFAAYLIVGRMAGIKDNEVFESFYSDKKKETLDKWIKKVK
jgi:hypothetical protein